MIRRSRSAARLRHVGASGDRLARGTRVRLAAGERVSTRPGRRTAGASYSSAPVVTADAVIRRVWLEARPRRASIGVAAGLARRGAVFLQ